MGNVFKAPGSSNVYNQGKAAAKLSKMGADLASGLMPTMLNLQQGLGKQYSYLDGAYGQNRQNTLLGSNNDLLAVLRNSTPGAMQSRAYNAGLGLAAQNARNAAATSPYLSQDQLASLYVGGMNSATQAGNNAYIDYLDPEKVAARRAGIMQSLGLGEQLMANSPQLQALQALAQLFGTYASASGSQPRAQATGPGLGEILGSVAGQFVSGGLNKLIK